MCKRTLVCVALTACLTARGFAQRPAGKAQSAGAAAPERTSITLYDKAVTVQYAAPSMKGRKILGGLAPLKQAWHVGWRSASHLPHGW